MDLVSANNSEVPYPRLLILTGPQGSGNHLWSKIFNTHNDSYGWEMKKFWEGHHKEPFAECWNSPAKFVDYQYKPLNVTSISNPYVYKGRHRVPRYNQVFKYLDHRDVYYNVVLLSRDKNILKNQQERVRKEHTTSPGDFPDPDYVLSYEALMLYGETYLKMVSHALEWPLDIGKALRHINEDTNKKYIKKVTKETSTDREVYKAVEESKLVLEEQYLEIDTAPASPEILRQNKETKPKRGRPKKVKQSKAFSNARKRSS